MLTTPPWSVTRFALRQAPDPSACGYGRGRLAVELRFRSTARTSRSSTATFPVILKPTVQAGRNRFTTAKAWRVNDRAALLARYDEAVALVGRDAIMIQEFIPGGGETQFSYAAVWDRGKPVASLVARRTRQYPVDFGFTSTFVETVEHREVEAQAFRFLADLRFSGLVEIEFKFDARDGRTKLLDVNPRPGPGSALGAAAGVDFPAIQFALATGETVPRLRGRGRLRLGHASRDVASAARSILAGSLAPLDYARSLLPPDRPSPRSLRTIRGRRSPTCRSSPAGCCRGASGSTRSGLAEISRKRIAPTNLASKRRTW